MNSFYQGEEKGEKGGIGEWVIGTSDSGEDLSKTTHWEWAGTHEQESLGKTVPGWSKSEAILEPNKHTPLLARKRQKKKTDSKDGEALSSGEDEEDDEEEKEEREEEKEENEEPKEKMARPKAAFETSQRVLQRSSFQLTKRSLSISDGLERKRRDPRDAAGRKKVDGGSSVSSRSRSRSRSRSPSASPSSPPPSPSFSSSSRREGVLTTIRRSKQKGGKEGNEKERASPRRERKTNKEGLQRSQSLAPSSTRSPPNSPHTPRSHAPSSSYSPRFPRSPPLLAMPIESSSSVSGTGSVSPVPFTLSSVRLFCSTPSPPSPPRQCPSSPLSPCFSTSLPSSTRLGSPPLTAAEAPMKPFYSSSSFDSSSPCASPSCSTASTSLPSSSHPFLQRSTVGGEGRRERGVGESGGSSVGVGGSNSCNIPRREEGREKAERKSSNETDYLRRQIKALYRQRDPLETAINHTKRAKKETSEDLQADLKFFDFRAERGLKRKCREAGQCCLFYFEMLELLLISRGELLRRQIGEMEGRLGTFLVSRPSSSLSPSPSSPFHPSKQENRPSSSLASIHTPSPEEEEKLGGYGEVSGGVNGGGGGGFGTRLCAKKLVGLKRMRGGGWVGVGVGGGEERGGGAGGEKGGEELLGQKNWLFLERFLESDLFLSLMDTEKMAVEGSETKRTEIRRVVKRRAGYERAKKERDRVIGSYLSLQRCFLGLVISFFFLSFFPFSFFLFLFFSSFLSFALALSHQPFFFFFYFL